MPQTDYTKPLTDVTFRCGACRTVFSAPPARVEEHPEREWHPWGYSAACPACGAQARQAPWEMALLKAWQNATGPRTAEGMAATTANLAGHPTPEEAKRTRFNALKHGLSAKTATYFPARPGKYPACAGCEVDRDWCAAQAACTKQTQLFMLTHAAFEQRNPKLLSGLYADLQAALFAVIQQILQTIIVDGVKVEAPQYYTDKDGQLIVAEYVDDDGKRCVIKDIQAHPLFKPLGELLSRNNLSLADMGMTQRILDDEDASLGRIVSATDDREEAAAFRAKVASTMDALAPLLARAQARQAHDPVLIEHKQQAGGG